LNENRGTYKLKVQTNDTILFELRGKKLRGDYVLRLIGERRGRRQWLLFKRREMKI